ncbi:hypothetical protein [Coxiella-like endosymbiont of Rhipicephalus sanguineus]|uniref:hypothetical protein n=1 Tax=Coxiella-like endosymbiont of Rhipicephalus sanguineus TaxID=1955402 RepID=UPI00203D7930|nr:hypothetical protein [Coxiella-like endosymbiont of Rhipicephalus sanguineus]
MMALSDKKISKIGFNQAAKLQNHMQNLYSQLIYNDFVLYLDGILTTEIHEMINYNEFTLYQALQTYFMLTESLHRNGDVI